MFNSDLSCDMCLRQIRDIHYTFESSFMCLLRFLICSFQPSSLFSERVLKVKQLHINIFWVTFMKNVIYEHKNDQLVIDNNESDTNRENDFL